MHLSNMNDGREQEAVRRWLATPFAHDLAALLDVPWPWWFALEVPRRELFGPGWQGDVDIVLGPLELNVKPRELDERVERESADARQMIEASHGSKYRDAPVPAEHSLRAAVMQLVADGRLVWPPDMRYVAAVEAKASFFEHPDELHASHAGERRRLVGNLRMLSRHGFERVAFLHFCPTKPRDEAGISPWFTASHDAALAASRVRPVLSLDDPRLAHCGNFVVSIGAVPHKHEGEAGAGGMPRALRAATANHVSSTTVDAGWRERLRAWLANREPMHHVRL